MIPLAHGFETQFCTETQDANWLDNPSSINPFTDHHARYLHNIEL